MYEKSIEAFKLANKIVNGKDNDIKEKLKMI